MLGPTRNLLLGAGLCYAWNKEQYVHVPAIIIFPSIYAGYHLYQNKDTVIRYIKEIKN